MKSENTIWIPETINRKITIPPKIHDEHMEIIRGYLNVRKKHLTITQRNDLDNMYNQIRATFKDYVNAVISANRPTSSRIEQNYNDYIKAKEVFESYLSIALLS